MSMHHYVSPEAEALYLQEMEEQARRATRQAPLHPAILAMEDEVNRNAVREAAFWDEVNEEAASFEY